MPVICPLSLTSVISMCCDPTFSIVHDDAAGLAQIRILSEYSDYVGASWIQ